MLKPLARYARRLENLNQRIANHFTAIEDEKLDARQRKLMAAEADKTWSMIETTLSRIGFRHVITRGNKTHVQKVKYKRIVVTPDVIQIQINTLQLGLLDGSINMLPQGVYSAELYSEKTLTELSIALERSVTSPNYENPDECPPSAGVWYHVNRLGVSDGLLENVAYRDVMARYPEDKRHMIPLPMGVKAGRYINWVYLSKQPHLMVNGTTGFGKSNVMRMVLSTVVSKHSPAEIQYVILDMKNNGDFRQFEDTPHCIRSVFNVHQALPLMESLFLEMQRRQEKIRRITNEIDKYNKLVPSTDRMPHLLIVFDEYPAIHVEKEVAKLIDKFTSQIAIQGRASGMHLLISGQQAYSSYVPSLVTANITSRFTAKQASVGASMSSVGDRSALKMRPLPGRFLCTSEGDKNYQVQMPFIEDAEIDVAIIAASHTEPAPRVILPAVLVNGEEVEQSSPEPAVRPIPNEEAAPDEEKLSYPRQVTKAKQAQRAANWFEMVMEWSMANDGVLNGRSAFQDLRIIPRNKIYDIIENIAFRGSVEWNGETYIAKRQPRGHYKLFKKSDLPIEADDETELDNAS
jgi:hypothetical protein